MDGCATDWEDLRVREFSGCPLRANIIGMLLCRCSSCYLEDVTNYLMCDVDWESCPDYQADNSDLKKNSLRRSKPLI